MAQLMSDVQISGNGIFVKLSGPIDVTAKFPDLAGRLFAFMDIDLENVTAINSMGIRLWISWIKGIANEQMQIRLHKAPVVIVDQINKVMGFLPPGAAVFSCRVPLYCEKCGQDKHPLVELKNAGASKDISLDKLELRKKSCADGDCELNFDVDVERYFAFLKRNNQN